MRYLLIVFTFLSTTLQAQSYIQLWGNNPDDFRKKAVRLYPITAKEKTNKAVIICPGGSYCYLAKENEGFSPAKMFNAHGYDSFVLLYRRGIRGNRYPAQIQDLQMAIHYIKTHYPKYDTIGVCGFSAGGHLSGTAAIYYNKDFNNIFNNGLPTDYFRPDFAIMIYPVITMRDGIVHKKSRRNLLGQYYTPAVRDSMSLEQNIHPEMPPVFIINCEDDPIVDYRNSIAFNHALDSVGVRHYYHLYHQGGHGFGIKTERIKASDQTAADWWKDFFKFNNYK